MQPRVWAALTIFLGSYLPLSFILLVQDIAHTAWKAPFCHPVRDGLHGCSFEFLSHPVIALSALGVTLLSVAFSTLVGRQFRFRYPLEVVESKPVPNDLINYVFPYVVSFMGLSYDDPQKVAGFLVFIGWMFAITYRSGQIALNPLLLIFGWQLYEAKVRTGGQERTVRVLKRGSLLPGPAKGELVQDFYFVEGDHEE